MISIVSCINKIIQYDNGLNLLLFKNKVMHIGWHQMNDIMNSFLTLEDRRNNDLKEKGGGGGKSHAKIN